MGLIMPETKDGGWLLDDSETGFGTYEPIAMFLDYLIVENGRWMGLQKSAPESAKQAYGRYTMAL